MIAAQGPVFCAGANIDDLRSGWMEGSEPDSDPTRFFRILAEYDRLTLAAVQGLAAGGGFELCLACDLVVGGPAAAFVAPELGHGVVPPSALALLPQIVGRRRALDLILTRRRVGLAEALALGLVSRDAGESDVVDRAVELADEIVGAVPPGALGVAKRHLARHLPIDWHSVIASPAEVPPAEWREGLDAFAQKRRPSFESFWASTSRGPECEST